MVMMADPVFGAMRTPDMNDLKRASRKGKKKNKVKEIWKRLRKNKSAMLGLFVLVFFSLVAIFAGFISPESLVTQQKAFPSRLPPWHCPTLSEKCSAIGTEIAKKAKKSKISGYVVACENLLWQWRC